MNFFIGGIMQGSYVEKKLYPQDYRTRIKNVIQRNFPNAHVFSPIEQHPNSLDYAYVKGAEAFFDIMRKAGDSDVVITYAPEASMGTAVEMWEGFRNSKTVICISPMTDNWTVKFLSHKVMPTMEEFEEFVDRGDLARLINDIATKKYRKEASL